MLRSPRGRRFPQCLAMPHSRRSSQLCIHCKIRPGLALRVLTGFESQLSGAQEKREIHHKRPGAESRDYRDGSVVAKYDSGTAITFVTSAAAFRSAGSM